MFIPVGVLVTVIYMGVINSATKSHTTVRTKSKEQTAVRHRGESHYESLSSCYLTFNFTRKLPFFFFFSLLAQQ